MIELKNNQLNFHFPEVHPEARVTVEFQRTFRIPDDGRSYPLPPGFGRFPMRHVDDFTGQVPADWLKHGGVMLPMYQSEALWINFHSPWIARHGTAFPFAVLIATGKINAVTGDEWDNRLGNRPQNYLVTPEQPWLDGYCVEKGFIRQFVAMPLGSGYTAEEQLTGKAEHGGLQVMVFPMKREVFDRRFPEIKEIRHRMMDTAVPMAGMAEECASLAEMGLAPGGKMRQEIYDDPYVFSDWDRSVSSRCYVHIANSLVWRQVTGEHPPTVPPTAREYEQAGLPWFDYYDDGLKAVRATRKLKKIKSVSQMAEQKGDQPLPENQTVIPDHIIKIKAGLKKDQVREGDF